MSLHAFVDESRRGADYLMALVLVQPRELDRSRVIMRGLVRPGQRRVHFKKESNARRRQVLAAVGQLGAKAHVWVCRHHDDVFARQACLRRMVPTLLELGVSRLVLESCQNEDMQDRHTLASALLAAESVLSYEHLRPAEDPILWVSDAVAWCYGAGGDWRR